MSAPAIPPHNLDAERAVLGKLLLEPEAGTRVLEETAGGRRELVFVPGPVFAQVVLADEINRATPKTQSALLEAMQDVSVTVGRTTYQLEQPFLVLATQNPLEMEGTYPLPEAQLDRFFFKLKVMYPSEDAMHQIVERTTATLDAAVNRVADGPEILEMRQVARSVRRTSSAFSRSVQPITSTALSSSAL